MDGLPFEKPLTKIFTNKKEIRNEVKTDSRDKNPGISTLSVFATRVGVLRVSVDLSVRIFIPLVSHVSRYYFVPPTPRC